MIDPSASQFTGYDRTALIALIDQQEREISRLRDLCIDLHAEIRELNFILDGLSK